MLSSVEHEKKNIYIYIYIEREREREREREGERALSPFGFIRGLK